MSNKSRKANRAKGPQAPGNLNLAGFVFLVVDEKPSLVARGKVAFSQAGTHHMVEFGGAMYRLMSNDSLQQGLLYPNDKAADDFLQALLSPPAPGTPGPTPDDDEAFDREAPPQLDVAPPSQGEVVGLNGEPLS